MQHSFRPNGDYDAICFYRTCYVSIRSRPTMAKALNAQLKGNLRK